MGALTAKHRLAKAIGYAVLALGAAQPALSYELYADEDTKLNADVLAVFGMFNSRKNYWAGEGGATWREGFIKYGVSAEQGLAGNGTLYGALNWVSSGTWGDGDAAGFTDGSERETDVEDAYIGWRSGTLFPALGENGIDFSVGRRVVQIGDGFIINDDGLNLGAGVDGGVGDLDRGGAYYLAARRAFDKTAVLKIGGEQGLHGALRWMESDNRAQANTELAAGTLAYTEARGTLALDYIHGLDVDERWASPFLQERDGMDIFSVRGAGNAGIENANFAFEHAWQDKDSGTETAWYVEAGYTFADVAWAPNLTYRYSRYSEDWDNLFTGFSRGYGTWFQGEVAANYAGPFNTNTGIHHLALKANPIETLTLGALFFDFNTLEDSYGKLDAQELDLYAEWVVNDHLIISPLVGFYDPRYSAAEGGSQVNGDGTNVYSQLTVAVPF